MAVGRVSREQTIARLLSFAEKPHARPSREGNARSPVVVRHHFMRLPITSPKRRISISGFLGKRILIYLGFCEACFPKKPLAKIRSGFLGKRKLSPTGVIPNFMCQKTTIALSLMKLATKVG